MMILIHTSKTMRSRPNLSATVPLLLEKSRDLANYLGTLDQGELIRSMKISSSIADKTQADYDKWNTMPENQTMAKDAFVGDIYSGLQASKWTEKDLQFAGERLRILSGLYGVLSPSDGVMSYRLEMGYKLPNEDYRNLYSYWGDAIARTLLPSGSIINLSAVEYSKTVTRYIDAKRIITPNFYTVSKKTGKPEFVVVHTKIARGAYANWLIKSRIDSTDKLHDFSVLGYTYSKELSLERKPAFVCEEFGGIGLSVRLAK